MMNIKLLINKLLGPYQISKKSGSYVFSTEVLKEKYIRLIEEYYKLFSRNRQIAKDEENSEPFFQIIADLSGISVGEALSMVDMIRSVLYLPGDVCEFGCSTGDTSKLIAYLLRNTDKEFWVYDSFEGLPDPTKEDKLIDDVLNLGNIENYKGTMKGSPEIVVKKIRETNFNPAKLRIIKGLVEDTVTSTSIPEKICFAFVDTDYYSSIKHILNKISVSVLPHGIIMVDDYGYFSSGSKTAVDEFMTENKGLYDCSTPQDMGKKFCFLIKK